ncbi:hypothetical protein J7T55_012174 [Diaporthe amygdali]|uniref:uncharacterized protein n=1 Tax=Phomopsis amygdali TaxID=1214568 RepID=UPI0022FEF407|nr:uncharacterized protein J7T55_012174 [Diaporthe amygdali]KAJ0123705.1 hypothetical protein J7T55_012174 [Diaporthe amygdali]
MLADKRVGANGECVLAQPECWKTSNTTPTRRLCRKLPGAQPPLPSAATHLTSHPVLRQLIQFGRGWAGLIRAAGPQTVD